MEPVSSCPMLVPFPLHQSQSIPQRSWQWHVHGLSFGGFGKAKHPKKPGQHAVDLFDPISCLIQGAREKQYSVFHDPTTGQEQQQRRQQQQQQQQQPHGSKSNSNRSSNRNNTTATAITPTSSTIIITTTMTMLWTIMIRYDIFSWYWCRYIPLSS